MFWFIVYILLYAVSAIILKLLKSKSQADYLTCALMSPKLKNQTCQALGCATCKEKPLHLQSMPFFCKIRAKRRIILGH